MTDRNYIAGSEAKQQSEDTWAPAARKVYPTNSICNAESDASKTCAEDSKSDESNTETTAKRAVGKPSILVTTTPCIANTTPSEQEIQEGIFKGDSLVGDDGPFNTVEPQNSTSLGILPHIPRKRPAHLHSKPLHISPLYPEAKKTATKTSDTEPKGNLQTYKMADSKNTENKRFIYLKSTSYTLTQPLFRHGPIALPHTVLRKKIQTTDDNLDWALFQTAIIGAAGDLWKDVEDEEEDIKELHELTSWFDDFGFSSCGTLITEDVPVTEIEGLPSMRRSCNGETLSTLPTVEGELDLPIPVGAEFPSGFWNASVPGKEFDKDNFSNIKGLKRWIGEGRPKRPSFYSTTDSPPQSPMMPLVVSLDGVQGTVEDTIPMGYNLSHDLGDFLSWQADKLVYL